LSFVKYFAKPDEVLQRKFKETNRSKAGLFEDKVVWRREREINRSLEKMSQ
jgi:hypothetical protein